MRLIAKVMSAANSLAATLQVGRYFAALLVGFVLLTSHVNSGVNSESNARALGEQIHQRLEQTDRNSERPKTTGEFLDEARGDVPLDERLHNITRDSAEALKQWGQEYSSGIKENARSLKDNVSEAGKDMTDHS